MKNQHGDSRYLDQVNKCITYRRALLGLDAPQGAEELSVDLQIASLPSLLRYASGPELAQLERDLALASPATFTMTTSRGRWQLAHDLACLD